MLLLISQGAQGGAFPANSHHFNRVIFVIFENTDYRSAIRQKFFKELAYGGVNFTNFSAETHPSQGNYIALTSGSLNGVKGDGRVDLDVSHIGDLLDRRRLSWKVYAEDYPGNCFLGSARKGYARKHNPFISYLSIRRSPMRCARIVDGKSFDLDVRNGTLPNFVFYVPTIRNDGHDTGVAYADAWYCKRFSSLFQNPSFMRNTLVITTFDENGGARGNQIYTSLYGPMLRPRGVISEPLDHYSLLRLIEDNWNLGSIGKRDLSARPIPESIWR
jgi:hypothetical protein